jgi:hypothetical protein
MIAALPEVPRRRRHLEAEGSEVFRDEVRRPVGALDPPSHHERG